MNLRSVGFASHGQLRAPWRIAVFLAASAACGIVAALIVSALPLPTARGPMPGVGDWIVNVAAVVGGTALALRWVERRPWSFVWLDRGAAAPRRLTEGFVLGVAAIGLPTLGLTVVGWLTVEQGTSGSWASAALRLSSVLLVAALAEELIFRGYLFAVLREAIGSWPTLVVSSVAFGFAHASNPGAGIGPLLAVTLAGFFLGAVVLATRSLYAVWLAHFAWNWTLAVLFHIPVSGLQTETPAYRTVDTGPDWATGGPWGPEGGVGAVAGMIGGLGYLAARQRRQSS